MDFDIIKTIHKEFEITKAWEDVYKNMPHYHLLTDNIFSKTIGNRNKIYLVSATDLPIKSILQQGVINPGWGCLGSAVYCVQAYRTKDNKFILHNFGSSVMKHKDYANLTPMIFEVDLSIVQSSPVNYLLMGEAFNYINKEMNPLNADQEASFKLYKKDRLKKIETIVKELNRRYKNVESITTSLEAKQFIDKFVKFTKLFRSLSYAYFEAVSLALMMMSTDKETTYLREQGEINNNLYIEFYWDILENKNYHRFDPYGFSPASNKIISSLDSLIKKGLVECNIDEILITIANNLILFSQMIVFTNYSIEGNLFFDFYRNEIKDITLQQKIDNDLFDSMLMFWRDNKIELVFNSTIPKGEIGISPHINPEVVKIFRGKYLDGNKSVEIVEPLNVTISPR